MRTIVSLARPTAASQCLSRRRRDEEPGRASATEHVITHRFERHEAGAQHRAGDASPCARVMTGGDTSTSAVVVVETT